MEISEIPQKTKNAFRIMALGDVVGKSGRSLLNTHIPQIRIENSIDMVIANGENAAGGFGLDPKCADQIKAGNIDVITLGDHAFKRPTLNPYLDDPGQHIIRPANFAGKNPGKGFTIWKSEQGISVGVLNVIGRTFMNGFFDCPFAVGEQLLQSELSQCDFRVVDIHAEATSEKIAWGKHFDGKVDLVFGTHTHVQTADQEIFPGGTAFLTDLGMCGPSEGILGASTNCSIKRFLAPHERFRYELAKGALQLCALVVDLFADKGSKPQMYRVRQIFPEDAINN